MYHRGTDICQGCPVSKGPMLIQANQCVRALVTTQNSYHLIFTFSDGELMVSTMEEDKSEGKMKVERSRYWTW